MSADITNTASLCNAARLQSNMCLAGSQGISAGSVRLALTAAGSRPGVDVPPSLLGQLWYVILDDALVLAVLFNDLASSDHFMRVRA